MTYYTYGNVIEVAKNRDLGIVDHLVGLYYEIDSKRFFNDFTDNPCYGWQDSLDSQTLIRPQFNQTQAENDFLSEPTPIDQLPF